MEAYLPDEQDWATLDRSWLANVIYTTDTEAITQYVDNILKSRRAKLEESQNQVVEMKPEFANALSKCLNFSSNALLSQCL